MDSVVLINLGYGNLHQGFPLVTVQLHLTENSPEIQLTGCLPAAPELQALYQRWQILYSLLYRSHAARLRDSTHLRQTENQQATQTRGTVDDDNIVIQEADITNVSEAEFHQVSLEFKQSIDQWLNSEGFRPIERQLHIRLNADQDVQVILQTDDPQIRHLPWYSWHFFQDYPYAELSLSLLNFEPQLPNFHQARQIASQVNILAILGDSRRIDIHTDEQLLGQLKNAHTTFLIEPKRAVFNDHLWQEEGWDILFFAGHSHSHGDDETGSIALNAEVTLTILQLNHALKKAVERGLQLAIFNSCDGLGLATQLAHLNIPQIIVMREPVSDRAAQIFLNHFLSAFSNGKSLYRSFREARERLQGIEGEFPGASWLPVLFHNPALSPPTWRSLIRNPDPSFSQGMITMVFTDLVNSTGIKNHLTGKDIHSRNQAYLRDILRPHRQRVEEMLVTYGGRVIKTEGDSHFLVFSNALQAAQWALELQENHKTEPILTPLGALTVRIGMHTGSPLQEKEDFIGQEVDYAARVAHEAAGGQILLSEVTSVLVRHSDCSDIALRYWNQRLLKGIGNVPLYEIASQGLQSWNVETVKRPHEEAAERTAKETLGSESRFIPLRLHWWRHLQILLKVSILTTTCVMGIRWLGVLQPLELWALDGLMQLRPVEEIDSRILLITIDAEDKTYQEQAQMPMQGSLADRALVQLLQRIKPYHPSVIGLDIYRDYRDVQIIDQASQAEASHLRDEQFIDICQIGGGPGNPQEIASPPDVSITNVGFSDLALDPDLVVRRQILGMAPGERCNTSLSFSFLIAQRYLSTQGLEFQRISNHQFQIGSTRLHKVTSHSGGYHRLEAGGFEILTNYRVTPEIAISVPLQAILEASHDQALADLIQGKIVLIGNIDKGDKDYHQTPYSVASESKEEVAGIEIHAQMISHLLSAALDERPIIWWWPQWGDSVWVLGWSLMGGVTILAITSIRPFAHPVVIFLSTGSMLLLLTGICFKVLSQEGGWLPLIPSGLGLVAMVVQVTVRKGEH